MATATLTRKGQATIPKEIRDHLGLKPGDRLRFHIQPDGRVAMIAKSVRLADLYGILPRPARPLSIEEMNEVIAKAAAG